MTWVAISDGRRIRRAPDPAQADAVLPRGTLLIELPFPTDAEPYLTLCDLQRDLPWRNRLRVVLTVDGCLTLEHLHCDAMLQAEVRLPVPTPGAPIRVSLAWHGPERIGMVTVEDRKAGTSAMRVFNEPRPLSLGDAVALMSPEAAHSPQITAVAVSDNVIPTGLAGGFLFGTLVDTPQGPRAIESLRTGDLVLTAAGGPAPVRQVVQYEAPNVGRFTPVRLNAPFFGLERDLQLAQDHRLLVRGADTEYLFGADEVLIEADHLRRIAQPLPRNRPATVRYAHLVMDTHSCISVGGGWGESLFLGDLADRPAQHATSVLADWAPAALPRHTCLAGPELRGYEAAVLVSAICA